MLWATPQSSAFAHSGTSAKLESNPLSRGAIRPASRAWSDSSSVLMNTSIPAASPCVISLLARAPPGPVSNTTVAPVRSVKSGTVALVMASSTEPPQTETPRVPPGLGVAAAPAVVVVALSLPPQAARNIAPATP